MKNRTNPIAAEAKAVYEGSKARYQDDGSFLVACRHPETCGVKSHRLTVQGLSYSDGSVALWVSCDCPSGVARPRNTTPCFHAAAVARSLERQKLAVWSRGVWYAHGALHSQLQGEPTDKPKTKRLKGKCPVCARWLTVDITNETPDVKELAATHTPECEAAYRVRIEQAREWAEAYERKHGKPFDLYGEN